MEDPKRREGESENDESRELFLDQPAGEVLLDDLEEIDLEEGVSEEPEDNE